MANEPLDGLVNWISVLLGIEGPPQPASFPEAWLAAVRDRLEDLLIRLESLAAGETPPPGFSPADTGLPGATGRLTQAATGFLQDLGRVAAGDLEFQAAPFGRFSECLDVVTENLRQATDQLVRQYLSVERLAATDPLTGVQNRGALMRRFEEEFARAARYGGDLSLILMDLDHFKAVNDLHGHPSGDDVLRRLGGVVNRQVRLTDVAGRFGGEEFMVVATETGLAGVTILAERIRAAFEEEVFTDGESVFQVTLSLGVAVRGAGGDTPEAMLGRADAALYRAKAGGRNRVEAERPQPN